MSAVCQFDLLTLDEVAIRLRCSKAHVSHLIAGKVNGCVPLPAVRLGRRPMVRQSSLTSWIEQTEKAANLIGSPQTGSGGRA